VIPQVPIRIVARLSVSLVFASLLCGQAAHAEKGDREKPINFSADDASAVNYEARRATLSRNVVITQGTTEIRADRIDFQQNTDNSMSATAIGNPVRFRTKRDGSDEYVEGVALRIVYDGQKQQVELFDRAVLKRAPDEIRSNYISYNTGTEVFKAEGRPDSKGPVDDIGRTDRVRGVFQPKNDAGNGKAPAKDAAKDATKDATKDTAKDTAKDAARAAQPLSLTPSGELAPAK
jgi:lipopolysaccharide export system protein LptA